MCIRDRDMAVIGDVSIGTLKAMCDAGKKG